MYLSLFNFFAVRERFTHLLPDAPIGQRHAVADNGVKFFDVYLTLFIQNTLIGTNIDDLANEAATVSIVADQLGVEEELQQFKRIYKTIQKHSCL